MGSLAEQDINGVTSIVFRLSCSVSSALVAIIAGTVQPNPKIIGKNAFPDNPTFPMTESITYATLAIYPLSSKIANARNRIKIFGRKVKIPPTPAIMPSTNRDCSHSIVPKPSSMPAAPSETKSSPISKKPFNASPTVKVKKNTKHITIRNTGIPQMGWVRSRSILSVEAAFALLWKSVSPTTFSI